MTFVSDYTLLSSTLTIEDIMRIAIEKGFKEVILADDHLYGSLDFFYQAEKNGIKPILSTMFTENNVVFWVIAKNGFGFKEIHSKNLEVLNRSENVVTILLDFKKPSDLNSESVRDVNMVAMLPDNKLKDLTLEVFANKYNKERIIYNPYRMENREDYRTLEALTAIKNSKQPKNITISMITKENPVIPRSIESFDDFKKIEGNKNIIDLASTCTLEGYTFVGSKSNPLEIQPPHFTFLEEEAQKRNLPLPITEDEFLMLLCKQGLKDKNLLSEPGYEDRLKQELEIISEMGFSGYMLLVWDFMAIAHEMNIPVGPGRGSAAGSLVAYALKITDINPIPYDLLFERFLNPERKTMPDIDMDFCEIGRPKLIKAVTKKYGQEHVAQIITFGTMGAKGAFKDAARTIVSKNTFADIITKMFPDQLNLTLDIALETVGEPLERMLKDPTIKRAWDYAKKIEGFKKNLGVHAAGVVIADKPVKEYAPVTDVKGLQVVQFEGSKIEDVNLIKFDFLGLKTLTIIQNTIDLIEKNHGKKIEFTEDYNDPSVFELIKNGFNSGLFQIESPGMTDLCVKTQPNQFEDIVALLALYRPGPMESGMLDDFIKRIRGEEEVEYFGEFSELLKPILEPTYGVIVYQEQVMQIVQELGGFSLGEADIIRRAMGKKDIKYMQEKSVEFADGAEKKGFTREGAISLFNKIEKFAGYGFNKSHSAAYAVLTYRTAYLKANYPAEFLTAILNMNMGDHDKLRVYIAEAKNLGIKIEKLNLDSSTENFETDGKTISYSFKSLKSVGVGSVSFIKAREAGSFESLEDLMQRFKLAKVKKAVFTSFVKVGLFDTFGYTRKSLIENDTAVFNLKEGWLDLLSKDKENDEYSSSELLKLEKDIAGLYITDPFEEPKIANFLAKYNMPNLKDLPTGKSFIFVYPEELVVRTAKKTGKTFGILTAYYGGQTIEIAGFDKIFEQMKQIDMDAPVILEINIKTDGRTSVARVLDASGQFKNCFSRK